jgi:hypothetical protein
LKKQGLRPFRKQWVRGPELARVSGVEDVSNENAIGSDEIDFGFSDADDAGCLRGPSGQ